MERYVEQMNANKPDDKFEEEIIERLKTIKHNFTDFCKARCVKSDEETVQSILAKKEEYEYKRTKNVKISIFFAFCSALFICAIMPLFNR